MDFINLRLVMKIKIFSKIKSCSYKTRTLGNVRKLRRVHLGTSAIQVNERDTGEQAKNQLKNRKKKKKKKKKKTKKKKKNF